MTTITIVGAGGFEFPLTLGADFLSFESMRDAHLVLMDIDPVTLARTERHLRRVVDAHGLPARITATTDRRAALTGADIVVVCFQVGGVDAYALDIEIPRRYGIDQTVGDTLGPGGIFRGLRSMHALEPITARHARGVPRRAAAAVRQPDVDELLVHVGRGRAHGRPLPLGAAHGRLPRQRDRAPRRASGRSRPPASTTSPGSSSTA